MILNKEICISFVVAVYNKKDYIRECLDSLLSQDIKKEIICVDDGSTDGTFEMLKDYEKKFKEVKVISNIINLGLIKTRLVGLKKAKGNYVMFVDADDSLVENKIPEIYQLAIDNDVDIIEFGYNQISDTNIEEYSLKNRFLTSNLLKFFVDGIIINNVWNKLISKNIYKLLLKNIDYDVEFDSYSDPILFLYTSLRFSKNILQTDIIAYNYYKNRTGMTKIDSNLSHYYHYCDFDVAYNYLKNKFGKNVYIEKIRNAVCNQAVDMYLRLKSEDQNERNIFRMKKLMTNREIGYLIDCHKNKN